MSVSPAVKVEGGVDRVRREGILCKRGDRWLKQWVDRRVLLQSGILSYFKVTLNPEPETLKVIPRGECPRVGQQNTSTQE